MHVGEPVWARVCLEPSYANPAILGDLRGCGAWIGLLLLSGASGKFKRL